MHWAPPEIARWRKPYPAEQANSLTHLTPFSVQLACGGIASVKIAVIWLTHQ
ncbi:hypothetical protein PbDSM24746_08470 [Paenibacillus macerans]|nr:hypothetical protein PbDSM24746_08470 [Paenibacillus macerans]GBK67144.1 hypothetical protein PbJCM17693_08520 [Paenibacillus macerans]GIP12960.1 hypothetical protein J1TS5_51300 [Paenibacillus macerans]